MPFEHITIPLAKGDSQDIDERVRPPDAPRIVNGYYKRRGAISKRPGFVAMSSAVAGDSVTATLGDAGPIRGLFSTGRELCVIGSRALYAYVEAQEEWYERGPLSPCFGNIERVLGGSRTWTGADCSFWGEFGLVAGVYYTQVNGEDEFGLTFIGVTVTGERTLPPRDFNVITNPLGDTTVLDKPFGPKCAACQDGVIRVLYATGDNLGDAAPFSAATLLLTGYDTATPDDDATLSSMLTSVSTDVFTDDDTLIEVRYNTSTSYRTRVYDIVPLLIDPLEPGPLSVGDYVVAFIKESDNSLVLQRRNADNSVAETNTIAGNFRRVALAVEYSMSPSPATIEPASVVVLTVEDDGEVTREVTIRTVDTDNMVVISGPVTLQTLTGTPGNGQSADNLGVTVGATTNSGTGTPANWACCVWAIVDRAANLPETVRMRRRRARCSNLSLLTAGDTYNVVPMASPVFYNGSFWVNVLAGPPAGNGQWGWHTNLLLDLRVLEQEAFATFQKSYVAGMWDVLTSPNPLFGAMDPTVSGNFPQLFPYMSGNCNTSVSLDYHGLGNKFSFSSHYLTYFVQDATEDGSTRDSRTENIAKLGASVVTLDFDSPVIGIPIGDDAAIITGACLSYYSGAECFELGFYAPPWVATDVGAASGVLTEGEYFRTNIWEHYDSAGVLHRSMPAFVSYDEQTLPERKRTFTYLTVPTNREQRSVIPVLFRETITALDPNIPARPYSRVTLILGETYDDQADWFTGAVVDGLYTISGPTGIPYAGAFLYTNGGQLANQAPEGFQWATVSLGRAFYGHSLSSARIQFTNALAPGTGSEDRLAPETNELLGEVMPLGEKITGLGDLDDKLIIFTESGIYMLAGFGPDATGGNNDFSRPTLVSADTGCVDGRSVVTTPAGVMFRGQAGMMLLDRGLGLSFAGGDVRDETDAYPVTTSASICPGSTVVLITVSNREGTDGRVLCFDYRVGAWSVWAPKLINGDPLVAAGGCVHRIDKAFHYFVITATGDVFACPLGEDFELFESSGRRFMDSNYVYVPLEISTGWFQSSKSGWQRARRVVAQLAKKDHCKLFMDIYADFGTEPVWTGEWSDAQLESIESAATDLELSGTAGKCHAVKVVIRDEEDPAKRPETGEGFDAVAISLQVKPKRGTVKSADAARRQ